ncbi:protein suppressor of k(+) transport growth defect 1, partial [Quercus suber]
LTPSVNIVTQISHKSTVLLQRIQLPSNTKADFDNVLATQKPTVSEADLNVYEKFTKEYVLYVFVIHMLAVLSMYLILSFALGAHVMTDVSDQR